MTITDIDGVRALSTTRIRVLHPASGRRRPVAETGDGTGVTETTSVDYSPPPPTARAVGILAASFVEGAALAAWVDDLGYSTRVLDADRLDGGATPAVVVSRNAAVLDRFRRNGVASSLYVLIGGGDAVASRGHRVGCDRISVIADSRDAPDRLRAEIESVLGVPDPTVPVPLTDREREVLTTYVLGATVTETAKTHYLAAATVRTHYRRVSRRYEEAGRGFANKSQLLLRMVADGWIALDE